MVESSNSNTARCYGPSNKFISFYENNTYRGYIGSYGGSASDMDFGTGSQNLNGKLHLSIKASPKLTINTNGHVGLGIISPSQTLHLSSGNILMANSSLGVILNNADKPMITSGFDIFTSGSYTGIGRWGLFMEPPVLTFGIPDLSGKIFKFARYNANSTHKTVRTID